MSRISSHIQSAVSILKNYNGQEPFSGYLKKFFAASKKFGSNDRKQISHLCYCYFRLGKACPEITTEQRILRALFMCSKSPNEYLAELDPLLNGQAGLFSKEKGIPADDIFPWGAELSESINAEEFIFSHFHQPDIFIRLRPGKREHVIRKLNKAEISFIEVNEQGLSFPNQVKLDKVLILDKEAVVQDLSSQHTGRFLKSKIQNLKSKIKVWDCCAGSGGKSIMVNDIFPGIDLTVSDIRLSILKNLEKRFSLAGINKYSRFVADLSSDSFDFPLSTFDLIIADVPCTGSGTWGRTPEQLYFFDERKINEYVEKQRRILKNVIPFVAPGGYLFYITCSVFRKENEERAAQIAEAGLIEVASQVIVGYNERADTMYTALFRKPIA